MKQSGTSCFLLLNWKGEFMYTTISTKNMSHEEWLNKRISNKSNRKYLMKQSGTSCFLLLNWKGEFMYTTISTKNMSHEEWLDLRKTGIGGSDAGAFFC